MKPYTLFATLALAITTLSFSTGCVVHETTVAEPDGPIVYQEIEPAPIVEVVPARPAPEYVYTRGGWYHDNHRWVWHRGRWHH